LPIVNSKLGTQVGTYHSDLVNIYDSVIGNNVRVGAFSELGGCLIGDNTVISAFCFICPGVTIGNNCFISPRVTFTNHTYPEIDPNFVPEKTIVGNRVVIGASALILPGVTIGDDVKIAAGVVVTRDVEAGAVVLGFPARERTDVWVEPSPDKDTESPTVVHSISIEELQKRATLDEDDRYSVVLDDTFTNIIDKPGRPKLSKEEISKFTEYAVDPVYCGELPNVSNSSRLVDEINNNIRISRTKKFTGKKFDEKKSNEYLGLNIGIRKDSGIDEGGFDK
jgi:acetyltransferase-like isoleucine patch superfamily enzyme